MSDFEALRESLEDNIRNSALAQLLIDYILLSREEKLPESTEDFLRYAFDNLPTWNPAIERKLKELATGAFQKESE